MEINSVRIFLRFQTEINSLLIDVVKTPLKIELRLKSGVAVLARG